ncbi:hypothetical protein ABEG63_14455 [Chryseobacterium sp. C39-AII1]|uniref:hypothetical protein n=1 Tax=Chryseobacterium sp. C39-AII1 TaxID=3080332 RepID=UPI003209B796
MNEIQQFFSDSLLWAEGIAAIIALFYYNKLKREHWKYFIIYLVVIFLCEAYGRWGNYTYFSKAKFYNYFVMPLQFIFFYWLYAAKSLKRPKLFFWFSAIYILSFIPNELFFSANKIVFAFNYTLGCLFLMFLVVMEYYKQINSTDILNFNKNKMFYITLGITLSYISTLPLFSFFALWAKYPDLWNIYYDYFLIVNVMMYILFSISFIWGKKSL